MAEMGLLGVRPSACVGEPCLSWGLLLDHSTLTMWGRELDQFSAFRAALGPCFFMQRWPGPCPCPPAAGIGGQAHGASSLGP